MGTEAGPEKEQFCGNPGKPSGPTPVQIHLQISYGRKKRLGIAAKSLILLTYLVGGAGFEPATPAV
jgi:hypothetical protein